MKIRITNWFYLLIVMGLVLFLTHSCCKKEEDSNILTDIEGNKYKTITIGTQVWMAENLVTTKYNDGSDIPLVTDDQPWSVTHFGYCWYNNDESNFKSTYGALYKWDTVESGILCPSGWHVPSDPEWYTLALTLDDEAISIFGIESQIAGGKLKEIGTTHWSSPNTGATNETEFTALPGGLRGLYGVFYDLGVHGYWWSSSEYNTAHAYYRHMTHNSNGLFKDYGYKANGFSVRCLKD